MALSKITNLSITDDTIVNADIKTSAAIALSKLATDPSNASNLASGTVPTARLGSGTASSSTVLYGDQTYKAEPGGGKILNYQYSTDTTNRSGTAGSEVVTGLTFAYTPSAATSRLFITMHVPTLTLGVTVSAIRAYFRVKTGTTTGGTELLFSGYGTYQSGGTLVHEMDAVQTYTFIHHPNTTSEQDYCLTVQDTSGTPTWKVSGCDNGWYSAISILEIDGS